MKIKLTLLSILLSGSILFSQNPLLLDGMNQLSNNGLKEGYWLEQNPRSNFERGRYVKGVKEGTWVEYQNVGVVVTIQNYKQGKKDGIFIYFDDHGHINKEEFYENDLPILTHKTYDHGRVLREVSFVNGMIQGMVREFYPSGNVKSEGIFIDNLPNGIHKSYFDNGKVFSEYNYVNGSKEGIQKFFDSDGNLVMQANYKNNLMDGLYQEFFPNGKVETEGKYKEGRKVGIWKTFDEKGKIISQEKF